MDAHEPFCDQRHPPRQRCNDALRGTTPAVASAPDEAPPTPMSEPKPAPERTAMPVEDIASAEEPPATGGVTTDETPRPLSMADTPEQPDIPETAFTAPVAAAYPSSESNGAATATPLTETLRTTTLGGAEWQKSLASLESPGATPTEPTAPAPGRRVPPKMIALAVTLASMAVLGAMLKRSRARRTSAD